MNQFKVSICPQTLQGHSADLPPEVHKKTSHGSQSDQSDGFLIQHKLGNHSLKTFGCQNIGNVSAVLDHRFLQGWSSVSGLYSPLETACHALTVPLGKTEKSVLETMLGTFSQALGCCKALRDYFDYIIITSQTVAKQCLRFFKK